MINNKKLVTLVTGTVLISCLLRGQEQEKVIRSLFDEALTDFTAWRHLEYLCTSAAGRLPGSVASAKAVEYTFQALEDAGADSVWLQKVPVPNWIRGYEKCTILSEQPGNIELSVAALGLSEGTDESGITAGVVEVYGIDQLKMLGKDTISGKIVFFNRAVDNRQINSFAGYGGAVDQRISGASEAAKYGALAVIVRSATQAMHDFPHTGVVRYSDQAPKIPAVAVSTTDAEVLGIALKRDPGLKVHLVSTCKNLPDTWSYNVIGEIRGTSSPDQHITVGGHLDSWDITQGAHDDAGGCVQAIEMIRLYKVVGIKPKRTVRAVMFMNEEMTGTGGRIYAQEAASKGEKHYAALESDRGVAAPRGFGFDAEGERLRKLQSLASYFLPYNIRDFDRGGGGSDIAPLKALGALQIGYMPETQKYFWYHHSANDRFEQVNIREMQMGSAAIASLVYLIDLLDL